MYETKPYFYGTGRRKDLVAAFAFTPAPVRLRSTTAISTIISVLIPSSRSSVSRSFSPVPREV